jgi:hypothetical protein
MANLSMVTVAIAKKQTSMFALVAFIFAKIVTSSICL